VGTYGFGGICNRYVEKPIIGAVNGLAFGGGAEMALAFDLLIASERATFALPEVKRGLAAGAGGLLRLPRQIPSRIAMHMALTGTAMTAAEALRWGMVNEVVPHDRLIERALEVAGEIAEHSAVAVAVAKAVVIFGQDANLYGEHASAWEVNSRYLSVLRASPDAVEGPRSFAEKRPAVWQEVEGKIFDGVG
jgi:crotonobetainyl-CoA hydratase